MVWSETALCPCPNERPYVLHLSLNGLSARLCEARFPRVIKLNGQDRPRRSETARGAPKPRAAAPYRPGGSFRQKPLRERLARSQTTARPLLDYHTRSEAPAAAPERTAVCTSDGRPETARPGIGPPQPASRPPKPPPYRPPPLQSARRHGPPNGHDEIARRGLRPPYAASRTPEPPPNRPPPLRAGSSSIIPPGADLHHVRQHGPAAAASRSCSAPRDRQYPDTIPRSPLRGRRAAVPRRTRQSHTKAACDKSAGGGTRLAAAAAQRSTRARTTEVRCQSARRGTRAPPPRSLRRRATISPRGGLGTHVEWFRVGRSQSAVGGS